MPEVAEWRFERGGWLQVYQLPERAGSGSFTLAVSDMDVEVRRLNRLNIGLGKRSDAKAVKTLMITDPDGNHIAFAQAIDPSLAQPLSYENRGDGLTRARCKVGAQVVTE